MKIWARIFGVAGLLSGALSFTSFGSDFAWGALKPLSAILLGAAFICGLFAPEFAQYDEEHGKPINDKARMANGESNPNEKAQSPADSSFELRH